MLEWFAGGRPRLIQCIPCRGATSASWIKVASLSRARVGEAGGDLVFPAMTLGHDRVRARVLEGFELRGRAAGVRGAPKMVASAKVRSPQRTCALVD